MWGTNLERERERGGGGRKRERERGQEKERGVSNDMYIYKTTSLNAIQPNKTNDLYVCL